MKRQDGSPLREPVGIYVLRRGCKRRLVGGLDRDLRHDWCPEYRSLANWLDKLIGYSIVAVQLIFSLLRRPGRNSQSERGAMDKGSLKSTPPESLLRRRGGVVCSVQSSEFRVQLQRLDDSGDIGEETLGRACWYNLQISPPHGEEERRKWHVGALADARSAFCVGSMDGSGRLEGVNVE
ncbi:hypothetical protein BJ875DRAFT_27978 [Amylocarpus encephaloides]|uniref:Uncharacterized protein n=1 Tax=Amylocarpus encephaloides TaxID=45428 RepID=A0A9P7YJ82_9HELO|nr:hypothetical protein BJ875DRAFT_27978 [Amylocarpus encephaloides]